MRARRLLAYAWAGPTTAVGLIATGAALASGGRARNVDGVLEVHGGFATFALRRLTLLQGGAAAMTLGHVVLGQDADSLARTRRHERVHVRQCERWGPLFLPAYLGTSAVLWLMRRDAYYDNFFEREAYTLDKLG
ncbi:MAG: hypothetical protein JWM57_2419 [Phycisphaerales bacterium]|nr:hypothetical protein [Phycisphaerales bacterium]